MSIHRIKLAEVPINNQSFHQQSLNHHLDNKHKKKSSVYKKQSRTPNYNRLKTDQKETSIIKHEIMSMHINSSASKLLKNKHPLNEHKKNKKGKHTISFINLTRSIDQSSKLKGSSTITKRKPSTSQFNQKIKSKMEDYKVLSTCLEEYVKEERRNHGQANLTQIIKIIAAFNRSEIGPVNKHLQKLIHEIIESISYSLPQPQLKSILKKSAITFDSPSKQMSSSQIKNIDTVKKRFVNKEQETKDVIKLQQNLDRLKYESNRLKNFLEEMAYKSKVEKGVISNKDLKQKYEFQKSEELRKLKEIANQQAKIIRELENSEEDSDTFRESLR